MRWQDQIDSCLQVQAHHTPHMPKKLYLQPSLRQALDSFDEGSTSQSTRAFAAAQAFTEYAVIMVGRMAQKDESPYLSQLRNIYHVWHTRDTRSSTSIHRIISQIRDFYNPDTNGAQPYELGEALGCVLHLLRCTHSINYGVPIDPRPPASSLELIATYFAVVSCMHREMCGGKENGALAIQLARALQAIA